MLSSRRSVLGLGACALVSLDACFGGGRTPVWNTSFTPSRVIDPARAEALHQEALRAWLGRIEEAQVEASVALWQAALAADSSRVDLWCHLSHAQYFMAFAHLEERAASDALIVRAYLDALDSAERGLLVLMPELAARTERGMLGPVALASLDARAAPLLYWRSSALGRWSHRDGLNTRIDTRNEVRDVMGRITELDRNYAYCGADRFLGSVYAVLPPTLGGDLDRARQHFLYAMDMHPGFLATRLRYAVDHAVRAERRDVFIEHLEFVIRADAGALPDAGPENQIAQRRAREALERVDYYFD